MKASLASVLLFVFSFTLFGQTKIGDIPNQSLDQLNSSIAADPANPLLYYQRADIYSALNQFENARSDYRKTIEFFQKNPGSHSADLHAKACYRLADDYFFRKSDRETAMKYVSDGLKVSESFKDLEIMEAIILGSQPSNVEAAKEKYARVSAKYPNDVRLAMHHAKFLKNHDPLAAAALYEKALSADPNNREALLSLGTIYNNEATRLTEGVVTDPGEIFDLAKKAAKYFEKLYKLNPSDKEVVNVLMSLYDELREDEKAKELKKNLPY